MGAFVKRGYRRWPQVALDVYRLTAGFPREERFGLTAHLRKSVDLRRDREGQRRLERQ